MIFDVFVSYAKRDKTIANAVCHALEEADIRCWIAPRDVTPGRNFEGEILQAIKTAKVMVLVFSSHANASDHVWREVAHALSNKKSVVPFRVEDTKPEGQLEYYLASVHWLDALPPLAQQHLKDLVNSVRGWLKLPGAELVENRERYLLDASGHRVRARADALADVSQDRKLATEPATESNVPSGFEGGAVTAPRLTAREMFNLGRQCETGDTVPKDAAAAVEWYQQAAEAGNSEAMIRLGRMHESGAGGLSKDDTQARDWFLKSAALGNQDAKVILARLKRGQETEVVRTLRSEAEAGSAVAMCNLGRMYDQGQGGLAKDEVEGMKWYRKAADSGSSWAMRCIGVNYAYGSGGVSRNELEAIQWYRKAAAAGDSHAMAQLGKYCEEGRGGVEKDEVEAAKWYQKAADAGNASAMSTLGTLYEKGGGGKIKNDVEALKWYRDSAAGGDALGMFKLGAMHDEGRGGLPNDSVEAASWYRKAADGGIAEAMCRVGWMYRNGFGGLAEDEAEALRWYRKAAAANNATAMFNLGFMHENGAGGLAQSRKEAIAWYERADCLGNEDAKKALARLGQLRRTARAWRALRTFSPVRYVREMPLWLLVFEACCIAVVVYCSVHLYFNKLKRASIESERKGLEHLIGNEYEPALADFNSAVLLNPADSDLFLNRGKLYSLLGQTEKAIEDYSRGLSRNPKDVGLLCKRGAAYSALGQDERAKQDFEEALSLKANPEDSSTAGDRAAVRKIIDIGKAIQAAPDNAELFDKRGEAYSSLVQYGRAIQDFDKAIVLKPYFSYYYHRGVAEYELRRYSEAVADYTTTLALGGEWGLVYKQRAIAYYRLGKNEMASLDLAKVRDLHEDDSSTEELLNKLREAKPSTTNSTKGQTQLWPETNQNTIPIETR